MSLKDKIEIWNEYKEKLLNEKINGELNVEKKEGPCEKAFVMTVTEALHLMKTGKVAGSSVITYELLKMC